MKIYLIFFNFRLIANFFSFAGKIKAWEENMGVTSAIGTQPEKNELHQQTVIVMMAL